MNARVYISVHRATRPILIRTYPVSFNQQITGLSRPLTGRTFGSFDADIQYVVEAEFARHRRLPPADTEDGLQYFLSSGSSSTARRFTELFKPWPNTAVGMRGRASVGGYR